MADKGTIAVIDIGKTNIKVVIFDAVAGREIESLRTANTVLRHGPYPHFDVAMIWAFICDSFKVLARRYTIDAISITAHGATGALVRADGELALPILDYEHDGPHETAAAYDKVRPAFDETGSPRLPLGLNLGAQVFWQQQRHAEGFATATALLMYPQYWAFRLTGQLASEVTSLGCHTDLWLPRQHDYSALVRGQNWLSLMPPLRKAADILGPILPDFAKATGLPPETPVHCGIHDSNASLYPHLAWRTGPFGVASTGTWVISFAVQGTLPKLDPARDTLMNVNALGQPVPSARFMGGREFEMLGPEIAGEPSDQDRHVVLDRQIMLLPALVGGSGPFAHHQHHWHNAEGASPAQKRVAASYYLALVEATCLALIGAQGPSIVEGPFAKNADFMDMLMIATGRPCLANLGGSSGTSLGAAMLAGARPEPQLVEHPQSNRMPDLRRYQALWTSLL